MNDLLLKNASEKLQREMKSENNTDVATMIQSKVADALDSFCRQDDNLAKAILENKKTFYECCKEILKDTKTAQYISDFEAYRRAVKFYLPDADIEFSMNIKTKSGISKIKLFDLM